MICKTKSKNTAPKNAKEGLNRSLYNTNTRTMTMEMVIRPGKDIRM
tara:strand:+ start:2323 stop:2460 length:138 start_codon:yes stop_codon:yes gene_type:complete